MNIVQKKYLIRFLRLNYLAFPFFAIITAVLIFLEALTYPGFIQGYLFLSPPVIFGLLVISAYFVVSGSPSFEKTTHFDILVKLTGLFLPAIILVGSIFLSLESRNYKGYVYTHGFHFDPAYFYYIFAIGFLVLLIDLMKQKGVFGEIKQTDISKIFLSISIISLFTYLSLSNLVYIYSDTKPRLAAAIKKPFADDLSKGRYLFADFYDYMQFVNQNTSSDAVIMRMTQQGKWPAISNDGYVRGFIYPRYTEAGDENSLKNPKITHVFIHRAYGPPRVNKYIEKWPTFPVEAEKIIYMKDNDFTKGTIELNKDYDPNDHTYDDLWGLIVLKR